MRVWGGHWEGEGLINIVHVGMDKTARPYNDSKVMCRHSVYLSGNGRELDVVTTRICLSVLLRLSLLTTCSEAESFKERHEQII